MKNLITFGILALRISTPVDGASAALWEDLMRSAAKGDEAFVAAGRAERVASELSHGGAARRALAGEVGEVADAASRSRRLKALLETTLYRPDPELLRSVERLAPNEMEAALVLARGSGRLIEIAPDIATRGRLLRQGGADLVAAVGLHGDDLAREATRLEALVSEGRISASIADRPALARFAEVMRRDEGGAWVFWQQYIAPHWKKWAASGAIAAYLANPEFFHDAAGKITEEGTRRVTEIAGKVVGGAMKGAGEGGKAAIGDMWRAFTEHYLHGDRAWAAWLGLVLVSWLLGMLLPRTRRVCISPLRWLFSKPHN